MTLSDGSAGVFPISYGLYPREGSRVITAQYDWTSRASYTESLGQLVAKGVETTIQAMFCDNSKVAQYVTFQIAGTGQVLVIPPHSQAFQPLFFTGEPLFTVGIPGVEASVTRMLLLNVPVAASVTWSAVS
jgi:hypothetical protein